MAMNRDQVFISYSHQDTVWLDRLLTMLKPLQRQGMLDVWADRRIQPGQEWKKEIGHALTRAKVAVLLVSPDFLASDFIDSYELPPLLEAARQEGLTIFWMPIRPCLHEVTAIANYQAAYDPQTPLSTLPPDQQETALAQIARALLAVQTATTSPSGSGTGPELSQPNRRSYPGVDERSATGQPSDREERRRVLEAALETAFQREGDLLSTSQDTRVVQADILNLQRQLREGHLKAGDFLLGRFKLLERLGSGGFATIWKGLDRGRHRQLVAIKILHHQYAEDRSRRERFFRGARQMAALHHQGIVRVLEEELAEAGDYFFVMEYLAGGDFRRAVLEDRLSVAQRLTVITAVGEALQFAHAQGVIHRDVKPANIVLDEQGRPKLTDFDLVRALDTTGGTRTGAMGTWLYAAPEVLSKPQEAGVTADVYGLAMTAVFALYSAELPFEVIADRAGFFQQLDTTSALKAVLQQALAWKPQERYGSVAVFCQQLQSALQSPAIPMPGPTIDEPPVVQPPIPSLETFQILTRVKKPSSEKTATEPADPSRPDSNYKPTIPTAVVHSTALRDILGSAVASGPGATAIIQHTRKILLERCWLRPTFSAAVSQTVERSEDLKRVLQLLEHPPASIVIHGIPGVGKSLFAHQIASCLDQNCPGGLLEARLGKGVPATQIDLILNQWASYGFGGIRDKQQFAPDVVRAILSGHGRLLVLLDDVEEYTLIKPLLEALPSDIVLLITTRHRDLASALGMQGYELKELSQQEALDLILLRLGPLQQTSNADLFWMENLSRDTGYHPLALDIAINALAKRARSEWASIVEQIAQNIREGSGFIDRPLDPAERDDRVEQSLRLGFYELDGLARERFYLLGAMAPDADFSTATTAELWQCSEEEAQRQLNLFVNAALLNRRAAENEQPPLWRQHRLLRAYALALLNEAGQYEQAARRHAAFYELALDRAEQEDAYQLLPMLPQLRHAFAYAVTHDLRQALNMTTDCAKLWAVGMGGEILDWSQRLWEAANKSGNSNTM